MLAAMGAEGGEASRRYAIGTSSQRWKLRWLAAVVVVTVCGATTAYLYGRSQAVDAKSPESTALAGGTAADSGASLQPAATTASTTSLSTTTTSTTVAPTTSAPVGDATAVEEGYVFPISPATSADYGRSHHDYPAADVFAPCGTTVVAPHAGVIEDVSYENTWTSATDTPENRGGLSFSIVGDDHVRYYGSHLRELDSAVLHGARVATGQPLGTVGDTGNAKGSGCHLHFGISAPCGPGDVLRRRGEVWPQEYLDAWRDGASLSPSPSIATHPC